MPVTSLKVKSFWNKVPFKLVSGTFYEFWSFYWILCTLWSIVVMFFQWVNEDYRYSLIYLAIFPRSNLQNMLFALFALLSFVFYSVQVWKFWLSWKKSCLFLPILQAPKNQRPSKTLVKLGFVHNLMLSPLCAATQKPRQSCRGEPRHHNLSGLTWGHYHGAP